MTAHPPPRHPPPLRERPLPSLGVVIAALEDERVGRFWIARWWLPHRRFHSLSIVTEPVIVDEGVPVWHHDGGGCVFVAKTAPAWVVEPMKRKKRAS